MKITRKINRNEINTKQEQYKYKRTPKAILKKGRINTRGFRKQHGEKTGATPNDSPCNTGKKRNKHKRAPKVTRKKGRIKTKEL